MNIASLAAMASSAFVVFGPTQDLPSGTIRSQDLQYVTYTLPEGKIQLYLTNDLTQGARFTGTVVAVPNGWNEVQRNQNESILAGYVVATGQERASPGQYLKFVAPAAGAIAFGLIDPKGRPAGTNELPLRPSPPTTLPSPELPDIVQPGKVLPIPGPFDGDTSNTSVRVGGKSAPLLAESPWQSVSLCPLDGATGKQTLEVGEGSNVVRGETRVVSIQLHAQKQLMIGQSTPVDILIRGMEGYSQPASVRVHNATPGIVRMADRGQGELGSNALFHLEPFESGETLRTVSGLTLTAISTGAFEIECQLASGLCGATTHRMFITGPSKSGNQQNGYSVEWTEVCYLGTCHLKKGHAGEHQYSWKKCKDDKEVPHKETFKTKDEQDAKFREVEKDRNKRKTEGGF